MKFFIPKILLIILSLLITTMNGHALVSIAKVSEATAKKLGISITSLPSGADFVRVTIQFKSEGNLKDFNTEEGDRIEMRVMENEKQSIIAPLQVNSLDSGHHSIKFTVARDQVSNISIMILVRSGLRAASGYVIELKDFIAI